KATLTEVHTIIEARCASCHHDSPSHPSFAAAPAGIKFNDANSVDAQAQVIHQQSVVTRAMPIGNLTGMTEEERLKVASWYATKASAQ
ncbi:MAG: putative membrane protein, partial [bacterium]